MFLRNPRSISISQTGDNKIRIVIVNSDGEEIHLTTESEGWFESNNK